MNLSDWLDATSPQEAGISPQERAEREAVRARVLKKAKTTIGTLRVARSRDNLGLTLFNRLVKATKDETHKITKLGDLTLEK